MLCLGFYSVLMCAPLTLLRATWCPRRASSPSGCCCNSGSPEPSWPCLESVYGGRHLRASGSPTRRDRVHGHLRRRTQGSGERRRRPRDVRETVKTPLFGRQHGTRHTTTPRWVSTATGVAPLPAWYNHRRVCSEVPQRGTRFRGGFVVRIPCSPSRPVYQTWCWFEVNARIHVYYL
jgi:hypothetical protein